MPKPKTPGPNCCDDIVSQYQKAVREDDEFWILGDFAIGKESDGSRDYLRQLFKEIPGRKHLIIGNHDRKWVLELGWKSVQHFAEIVVEGRRVSMSHYPMITFPGARHGAIQLFGHVHGNWGGSRNSVNVGVDLWDYRPASLEEILLRARSLPVNPLWEVVEPGAVPLDHHADLEINREQTKDDSLESVLTYIHGDGSREALPRYGEPSQLKLLETSENGKS